MPEGIHVWRKTDCASIAYNYYQWDLPLLEPEIHHAQGGNNKAVGEFPIFYFVVAKLYQVFGYSEGIFRLLWLLISLIGFYHLYRWFFLVSGHTLISISAMAFCYSSPIYLFYVNNYVPDPLALALSFVGLYWLSKSISDDDNRKFLWFAVIAFTLTGLTKVTDLAIGVAVLGTDLINRWHEKGLLYSLRSLLKRWPIFIPLLVTAIWVNYAQYFNAKHGSAYFLLEIQPYWMITKEEVGQTIESFRYNWLPALGGYWSYVIAMVSIPSVVWLMIKRQFLWSIPAILFLLFLVLYAVLFFRQFRYHDYYLIVTFAFLPLLIAPILASIKSFQLNKWVLLGFGIYTSFIANQGFIYARHEVEKRWEIDAQPHFAPLAQKEMRPYIESLGVSPETYVLSVDDQTPNMTLYYMNLRGYTNLYHNELTDDYVSDLVNSKKIDLIITNNDKDRNSEVLQPYLGDSIGSYKGIKIFKVNR